MFAYLLEESLTESKIILIINFLYALLFKDAKHNKISIYENYQDRLADIQKFRKDNKTILENIKTARDKTCAHIDLHWEKELKSISFNEIEVCIKFLNDLLGFKFEPVE